MSTESIQANSAHRLIGLQYLRGMAALLVLLDHVGGMLALPRYVGRNPLPLLGYGAIGVDIFFTISGFIIVVACFEAQTLSPRVNVAQFLKQRFARIVPFLWVCVIAFAIVRWAGRGLFEWAPYIRSLTLWPLGEVRPNVVWTLRHEALFYLTFAISMLWLRRPILLICWCISPAILALTHLNTGELGAFLFNPVNLEFGAGAAAGWVYLMAWPCFQSFTRQTFLCTVALIFATLGLAATLKLGIRTVHFVFIVATMSIGLVFFSAFRCRDPRLLRVAGTLVGDASYSIYLTHALIVLAALETLRRLAPGLNSLVLYGVLTLAGILGGVAIHLAVERPIVTKAQRALGLKNRSVAHHPARIPGRA
jgi:exopolysaccharide production protein ExoZ